MKKFKFRFTAVTVAIIFVVIVVVTFLTMFIYYNVGGLCYTVGHAIDTVYYEDEDSYNKFLNNNNIEADKANDTKFISGASKELWFDDNNIWDLNNCGGILTEYGYQNQRANSAVKMTLNVAVWLNEKDNTYLINGNIMFDDSHGNKFVFIKPIWLDIMTITWGSEGEIDFESLSSQGTYSNGKEALFDRGMDAPWCYGASWSIEERNGNSYMSTSSFSLTLQRKEILQNKKTDLLLTYFHSFDSAIFNVDYGYNDGNARIPRIINSMIPDEWKIEIHFDNILEY